MLRTLLMSSLFLAAATSGSESDTWHDLSFGFDENNDQPDPEYRVVTLEEMMQHDQAMDLSL